MSAGTKAALEAALAAHVEDESPGDGAILTGYVLHAAYLDSDMDEATGHMVEVPDGQGYHVGYGLAHQLVDGFRDGFGDDDDD